MCQLRGDTYKLVLCGETIVFFACNVYVFEFKFTREDLSWSESLWVP